MSSKSDFLKTVIRSLSPEKFSEAVAIFERSYLNNEIVSVDGHDDGGCDIKIFKNRKELNRCVQVTVNKSIKNKIYDDLKKVDELINKYGYSSNFDYFCSVCLSDSSINEYREYANNKYCIELNIYDGNRLAQLNCVNLQEYLYSLVPKSEDLTLDKATRLLYQMLASGKDTAGIKNSILYSIIVSILFERGPLSIEELSSEFKSRIKIDLPNIALAVRRLSDDSRVLFDRQLDRVQLTESERESISEVIATSSIIEEEFISQFNALLLKYQIDSTVSERLLSDIKNLYKNSYKSDIDGTSDTNKVQLIDTFKDDLSIYCHREVDSLFCELKELCDNNSYLNRITASESFLSLYQSNGLEHYLNHKKKIIFLDTPAIVYLLLSKFSDRIVQDWNDPDYKSMCSLSEMMKQNEDRIELCVYRSYLYEVAWEIKKALQLSWLDECSFTDALGETANNFYNYYHFMRGNDYFEIDESINSVEDLIYSMGIDDTDVHSVYFVPNAVKDLSDILEDYGILVEDTVKSDCFQESRIIYEKQLMHLTRTKSPNAIANDVSQMLYLLTDDAEANDEDLFLSTWDSTLFNLRDELIKNDEANSFHYFNICNPAVLSNRIALEFFNIDQSAITNDVFLYAEKEYDLSKRIKSLRDIIAPLLGKKDNRNSKLVRAINTIKKKQLRASEVNDSTKDNIKTVPLEDVLLQMMKADTNDKEFYEKFVQFVNNEDNTDYIIQIIEKGISSKSKNEEFDYSSFYSNVESGILPQS